mgnify:CR=1 FL=1
MKTDSGIECVIQRYPLNCGNIKYITQHLQHNWIVTQNLVSIFERWHSKACTFNLCMFETLYRLPEKNIKFHLAKFTLEAFDLYYNICNLIKFFINIVVDQPHQIFNEYCGWFFFFLSLESKNKQKQKHIGSHIYFYSPISNNHAISYHQIKFSNRKSQSIFCMPRTLTLSTFLFIHLLTLSSRGCTMQCWHMIHATLSICLLLPIK